MVTWDFFFSLSEAVKALPGITAQSVCWVNSLSIITSQLSRDCSLIDSCNKKQTSSAKSGKSSVSWCTPERSLHLSMHFDIFFRELLSCMHIQWYVIYSFIPFFTADFQLIWSLINTFVTIQWMLSRRSFFLRKRASIMKTNMLWLPNTLFLFVCLYHSSSERCTMGRLDGKVIVLSAAAQGIGRAAAIVMSFNKIHNSHSLICFPPREENCRLNSLCLCAESKQCTVRLSYIFQPVYVQCRQQIWMLKTSHDIFCHSKYIFFQMTNAT